MSFGKNVMMGMMGAFLKMGVSIDHLDLDKEIMKITLPKDSYEYHKCISKGRGPTNPEELAKRIKESFIELGIVSSNFKVLYKVIDIAWTEEDGEDAFNKNKNKIYEFVSRI